MRTVVGVFALATAVALPASDQVTFTKDVAPIFWKSCQNCHRPGSIAPTSLLTYEDARPWAVDQAALLVAAKDVTVTVSAAR